MAVKGWVGGAAWLCLLIGVAAHSAPPMRFEHLGLDAGLSQLAANAIAQDPAGFLWIGTEEGLDRYDGYVFQHFRHDRANPRSLANDFIGDVKIDTTGALWVATDGGGVLRRDSVTGDFEPVIPRDALGLERVRTLCFDRAGRLWIASRDAGVAVFDPRTQRLTRFKHDAQDPRTLSDDSAFALLADRSGSIWVGTEAGLDRIDPVTGTVQRVDLRIAKSLQSPKLRVRALLEDRYGSIWVGTAPGLVRVARGEATWFKHDPARSTSLATGQINALLEDRHSHLWVGGNNGLALFNPESQDFQLYRHDPANPDSLPDDQVMALHEDRSGLLWVGTKFGGVAHWNPRTWAFGHQPTSNVMAFAEDRAGRLWIGSIGGGLALVDRRTGATRSINHLSDDRVMALLVDRKGGVWAGTMNGGLDRIAPDTLKVTVYSHRSNDPHSLGADGVMSLFEDSTGRIWVGTYGGGLSRYERETDQFVNYTSDPADPNKLESGRVTALAEDRNGRIWAGTDGGGLHVFDPAQGRFFRLPHDEKKLDALSADTVYSIHVDGNGRVWVGTRGGGLDLVVGSSLEPQAIRFRNYSESAGLPNNTIYGIHNDALGGLWLSTNRGLARFDPQTGATRAFHRDQGLQGEEFNFGAHYANTAGELFFGGPNGYNVFAPDKLEFDSIPPPVVLTSVTRSGHPYNGPMRFNAGDGAITFQFAALDFASPLANQFQYLLDGFDKSWSAATPQRTVSYTNLDGGHYTLRVRAANADGAWSEHDLAIGLEVMPPAWKSAWAYAGYALIAALLSWLAWWAHYRSLKREMRYSQKLKAEVRRRTLELERVSHLDALTGLGNRRALINAMPHVIDQAHGARLALMVIDLDNLKPINDQHGHESGDRVLASVSTILRESLSDADRVVRWGGDEFVLVKVGVDLDEAAALAERIRARLASQRFALAGHGFARTSCSIGFAMYPFVAGASDFLGWQEVLNLADIALYRAKAQRNSWCGWSGKPAAASAPDLAVMLTTDMSSVEDNYVESRRSDSACTDDKLNVAI